MGIATSDNQENGTVSISMFHHQNHMGNAYKSSYLFTDISSGSTDDILLESGSKEVHLVSQIISTGETKIRLHKGSTFTDKGTSVNIRNMNEMTEHNSEVTVYSSPSVDAYGDVEEKGYIAGGSSPRTGIAGGDTGRNLEEIFEPNSNHTIEVENMNSNSDMNTFVVFYWYEVESGSYKV